MLNKLLEKFKNLFLNSNSEPIKTKNSFMKSNEVKQSIVKDLEIMKDNSLEDSLKQMGLKSVDIAKRRLVENKKDVKPNNQIQMKNEILSISKEIDKLEEEFDLNNTCRNGCHHCCYHPIFINAYEQVSLLLPILNLDLGRKNGLFKRANEAIEKIDSLGLFDFTKGGILIQNMNDYSKFEKSYDKDCDTYFDNKIPCPFLLPNKLCMFYDIRPSVCWAYRVYTTEKDCLKSRLVDASFIFTDWKGYFDRKVYMSDPSIPFEPIPHHLLPYTVKSILIKYDKKFKRRNE